MDILHYHGPGQTRDRHLDHLSEGHVLVGHQVSAGLTGVTSDVTGGDYDHSMIVLPLFDADGRIVDAVMVTQAHRTGVDENRLSRYVESRHVARIDWSVIDGLDVSAMIRTAAYLRDTPYGVGTIAAHAVYEATRRLLGAHRAERWIATIGADRIVSRLIDGTLICSQTVALILLAGESADRRPLFRLDQAWRVHPTHLAAACPAPSYSTKGGGA
jgi:hypothetical protein